MAGPAPKTRDWSARENVHKPKGLHVIVHGIVQVNSVNMEPRLKEQPERNPKNLGLALTVEKTGGPGPDVQVWKSAVFHKEVKANEYDNVVVRWNVNSIARFPVINDTEHGQRLAALTAAANAKHGKAPKKATPKKAAKKAAPKKTSKPAKKAAKKTAKKKTAKKPAKKSVAKTVKKLVRKLVKKFSGKPGKKAKKRR